MTADFFLGKGDLQRLHLTSHNSSGMAGTSTVYMGFLCSEGSVYFLTVIQMKLYPFLLIVTIR